MSPSLARAEGVAGARILGLGSSQPDRVVTNDELAQRVDTDDEWIRTRTGIRERRVAAEGQTTSELGYQAALRALEAASSIDAGAVAKRHADSPAHIKQAVHQARIEAVAQAGV